MNENDIITKEITAVAAEEKTEASAVISDEAEPVSAEDDAPAAEEIPAEEIPAEAGEEETPAVAAEDGGENADGISDEVRLRAVTDPMFATFAKAKAGTLDEIVKDFIEMKSLGAGEPKLSPMTLATPVGAAASPDYALSERQRKIAQSAGMSYREYYNFLKSMK